ncbi:uncharacterized protein MONOS_12504 [Monocercomonoides exilis]|uniref:uncharacterized protein n=1 Tax=Monocercomonoides exilis TaxID=2049356 RepID=UPI00355994A4|nr:hypothetical protein MONOS_12504 [Monocercomonoides exilis]|eukprot:MONOS_12504.1-p1 / transcript=MONOS_12504.1 / gene=MONOS_12504 / organism=Monocercomonoides_exilis_PA203 / gene_product=unspecified product / transcript_product=unspecified product / location=Mono_scaffold00695:32620-32952(-) / protein_length=111 / sequence_SO=supercontig / SO=protein_coding / is_pseudo=false
MVICIALHSDFSSDSDTSSASSTCTIVTSSSDCSSINKRWRDAKLPSSAFEDADNQFECLRWKAPELMENKNMGATKEKGAFSIWMMLWECLTLQIPLKNMRQLWLGRRL